MFVIVIELLWLSIKAKLHGKFVKYLLAYLGRIFQLSLELLNSNSKCYHFSVVFFLFFSMFSMLCYTLCCINRFLGVIVFARGTWYA